MRAIAWTNSSTRCRGPAGRGRHSDHRAYVLPALIGKFQQLYPKVTLEVFEDTTERLVQRLKMAS